MIIFFIISVYVMYCFSLHYPENHIKDIKKTVRIQITENMIKLLLSGDM